MRNIHNLLICLILLFISLEVYSQDRVNLSPEKFNAKSSKITSAILWTFKEPNWVSRSNYHNGHDYNFNYIRFGEVKSDTTSYYVLIKNYNDGAYKYPSIYEGWYGFKSISFYIYTKQSYNRIKNIQQGDSIIVSCIGDVLWRGNWGEEYNEHIYVKKIKEYINDYESDKKKYVPHWELLYIKRTKSDGKDVIRLWFPDDCFQHLNIEFDKTYWELTYQSFKNLFFKN